MARLLHRLVFLTRDQPDAMRWLEKFVVTILFKRRRVYASLYPPVEQANFAFSTRSALKQLDELNMFRWLSQEMEPMVK